MKNLALALVAVLGTSILTTAAPIQTKQAAPVKEVKMAKPATHKAKKAKKPAAAKMEAKAETPKAEVKK